MSIARDVRRHLDGRPVIQQAMGLGIVNQRALARLVAAELDLEVSDAVQAACRRYRPPERGDDRRLREVLASAQMDVRTRMAVVTARQSWSIGRRLEGPLRAVRQAGGLAHIVHGSLAVTVIVDAGHVDAIVDAVGEGDVAHVRTGLAQVNVRTPDEVEDVPGVLVRVADALAMRRINSVEVLSCHKDNIFLVAEDDLAATLDALATVVG